MNRAIAYSFPILVSVLLVLITGCSASTEYNPAYYTQAVSGHFSLMRARQPVDKVIAETDNEKLKQRLQTAKAIRRFAIDKLQLPDNNSYTRYVQLKERFPVWNIVAAEALSLQPKQWCYLVIGCAAYRGYYSKQKAEAYATGLREQGYDVLVGGVPAYSTLGWFADPLTSAIIRRNDANLADLVFHELAHQRVFIKSDSRFNEAFATAVGEQGTLVWLEQTGQQEKLQRYRQQLRVYGDFLQLIRQTRQQLQTVYQGDASREQKLEQKDRVFAQMREDYQRLKEEKWQGVGWYDNWFKRPLNNARFVAIATYRDRVPEFVALLEKCQRDFARFYQTVEQIGKTKDKNLGAECVAAPHPDER